MTQDTAATSLALQKAEDEAALALITGGSGQGTEGFEVDDLRLPRLSLAQGGSPQVKRANPKYIDGLREGDLFNDLTGEIYGGGPLEVVFIRFLGKRAMEFWSKESGQSGVKDFDVDLDDPRLAFTTDDKGNRISPAATLFYDYLIFLPKTGEVVTFSFKKGGVARAKELNSQLAYPLIINGQRIANPPAYARTFDLNTGSDTKKGQTYAVATISGVRRSDSKVMAEAANLYQKFAKKNVVLDRTDDVHEERAAARNDEDVPF
jgi:hypothetical protein